MADFDVFAKDCPSREVFAHVTGRWGALVLGRLRTEPQRFGEIRRQVEGISDRMLTQTLRALVDDGLVSRYSADTNPPRTEYRLTPAGADVAEAVLRLAEAVQTAMPAARS
ncbi:helix-turn-helix transcriptional regulator [Tsukamurella tyrosinosolvens]|uniref:DNA-binding transcriptional regulator, HxlR family n=1 Tax=Tsukamurella tyrosinosolvens TaxID=57704 RepID=A0A1H4NSF0_TSUTY|nr:helix-turn-helix domain-containing protein [Tsukamurella tyrosinosolvens]AUN39479.1 transcriptional regulator [Tsukamurella tyrosinosolvens]KXO97203.1 HxlR family transcriptional regulator [Tsukamurella tyrosinosolvens]KXP02729.1 HxlR family transcriptional regulator [Tsukamurella tyrosinosolvens]KZL96868.1 HxlR family transcriptional regulator [Tsukamurella tyrosinosolvens]MCA4997282.1 helix-turn-helix transcriptional regulator [Tsukamurella tyrosinosolvens]